MARDENLQGTKELIAKLDELGALADGKALAAAARAGMTVVKKAAISKIPVGTVRHRAYHKKGQAKSAEWLNPGYAKAHVRISVSLSADHKTAVAIVGPTKKAFYASAFVERGTKKQSAQPWLRPAFYENQNDLKQAMYDRLNAYIVTVCKQQGIGIGVSYNE